MEFVAVNARNISLKGGMQFPQKNQRWYLSGGSGHKFGMSHKKQMGKSRSEVGPINSSHT